MATNPMQRKARNSFLLGMLVMLLLAAIIIGLLFMQLIKLQEEKKAQEATTKSVLVVSGDIKSGDTIEGKVTTKTISGGAVPTDTVTMGDITELTIAKIALSKGTILTKSNIEESTEKTTADIREQQYNMIVLPQELEENDFIDIRLSIPTGQDYIVVSKKKIKRQDEENIWINMAEEEILAMNNAIVEAYTMNGSKLYATRYIDAGVQAKATPTYPVKREVLELINNDPNVVEAARTALWQRYNQSQQDQRNNVINSAIQAVEQGQQNIESKVQEEVTKSKETRKNYLDGM